MKVGLIVLLFFICLAASTNAWSVGPEIKPNIATTKSTPSKTTAFSRRGFVATSVAGTVLAGNVIQAPPATAATTTGKDLVKPDSLKDKVIVITGGTTGLGLESGKALAKGGATVVLTARTREKGAKAVAAVQDFLKKENIQNNKVYTVQLDLDDLDNVKSFPQRFESQFGSEAKIDVLMNNAGKKKI